MLDQVNKTLAKKDITLDVTDAAKELLMEQGYDKTMGARPLRRVIESEIRDNVTDFYLDHIDAKHLLADVVDGHIVISEKDADKDTNKKSDDTSSDEKSADDSKQADDAASKDNK